MGNCTLVKYYHLNVFYSPTVCHNLPQAKGTEAVQSVCPKNPESPSGSVLRPVLAAGLFADQALEFPHWGRAAASEQKPCQEQL